MRVRPNGRLALFATVMLARLASGAPAQRAPATHPATILLGQSWLGRWQDDRLIAQVAEYDWQFSAVRLSSDRQTIEVAAYPANRDLLVDDTSVRVLRFDPVTLRRVDIETDVAAVQWMLMGTPVRAGDGGPSKIEGAPRNVVAIAPGIASASVDRLPRPRFLIVRDLQGRIIGRSIPLAANIGRVALSPDGELVVTFTRKRPDSGIWRGQVRVVRTGRERPAPGLAIDIHQRRDPLVDRGIACLLPGGNGAIITYLGAPADSYSKYLPFKRGRSRTLDTPYVRTCIVAPL